MWRRELFDTGKKRKKRTKRIALYTLRRTWHHTIVDHRHKPLTTVENPKPQIRRTLTIPSFPAHRHQTLEDLRAELRSPPRNPSVVTMPTLLGSGERWTEATGRSWIRRCLRGLGEGCERAGLLGRLRGGLGSGRQLGGRRLIFPSPPCRLLCTLYHMGDAKVHMPIWKRSEVVVRALEEGPRSYRMAAVLSGYGTAVCYIGYYSITTAVKLSQLVSYIYALPA